MYFETINFLSALSFWWIISVLSAGLSCAKPSGAKPSAITGIPTLIILFTKFLLIVCSPSGFKFRVLDVWFTFQVSGFEFQMPGVKFRVSGWISGVGFRVTVKTGPETCFFAVLPNPEHLLCTLSLFTDHCSLIAHHRSLLTDDCSLLTDHCSLTTDDYFPRHSTVDTRHSILATLVIRHPSPLSALRPPGENK